MNSKIKKVFIILISCFLLIAIAGMYKFNYLASQEGYDVDGNKYETIYFDPEDKKWKDEIGVCHTCTDKNGFTPNGQIKGREVASWVKIKLKLENDLSQNPPIKEVKELFNREYNVNPKWFGTHIELKNNVFTIIFPASKSLENEYKNQRGALKAYYIVTEIE